MVISYSYCALAPLAFYDAAPKTPNLEVTAVFTRTGTAVETCHRFLVLAKIR